MVEKCFKFVELKGVEALRLSYLYDGSENLPLPPVDIFVKNNYKKHDFENISREKLCRIIALNSLCSTKRSKNGPSVVKSSIFPFMTFINHARDMNIDPQCNKSYVFIFASRNIPANE